MDPMWTWWTNAHYVSKEAVQLNATFLPRKVGECGSHGA